MFFIDVNGDGLKDILSGQAVFPPNTPTNMPVVYLNKGDFSFTDPIPLSPVGAQGPTNFSYLAFSFVMDANGDGIQELVTSVRGARVPDPQGVAGQFHYPREHWKSSSTKQPARFVTSSS